VLISDFIGWAVTKYTPQSILNHLSLKHRVYFIFIHKKKSNGDYTLLKIRINQAHYRPEVPRAFQEVNVPRLRDNVPEWW